MTLPLTVPTLTRQKNSFYVATDVEAWELHPLFTYHLKEKDPFYNQLRLNVTKGDVVGRREVLEAIDQRIQELNHLKSILL